jgi:predicted O-methyltransferase YrrM
VHRTAGNVRDRLSRATALLAVGRRLRHGYLLVRRLFMLAGFQLILSTYDSPIPDLRELEPDFFEQPSGMRGIEFEVERQAEFVEQELATHCRAFSPPGTAAEAGPHRFHLHNGTYESVDAELLYAMVRRFKPARIVELGSGYSTLIIREALERAGGPTAEEVLRTYDPYRSDLLPAAAVVTPLRAQEVPEEEFAALGEGDLLFVDTSHTVKIGGDVNRIVLDVLPTLQPGVIVHFHDVFLPYPYSRGHLEDAHFWTEQYLLQAFLAGNPAWEVLIGAYAVARAYPERLAGSVPSFGRGVNPGAFWIRRRA